MKESNKQWSLPQIIGVIIMVAVLVVIIWPKLPHEPSQEPMESSNPIENLSSQERVRLQEIVVTVMQQEDMPTQEIYEEFWTILAKAGDLPEIKTELVRDYLTGPSIKYMRYFYEDALVSLSIGRPSKSNARERYEKRLMELGVMSEWRSEENQKLIEKIAKQEPVETGQGEIVFTKEIIESAILNLENVAARMEKLLTRESSTTREPSIVGKVLWNSEPAENISVKLCAPFPPLPLSLGGCEVLEKDVITDASGEYRYFNIPSGEYGLLYKWPEWDSDDWGLGQTEEEKVVRIIVEEKGVAKADSLIAFKEIELIAPKEILDYPRILQTTNQRITFEWKPIEGTVTYLVTIWELNEDLIREDIFFQWIETNPTLTISPTILPQKSLDLQIRAYNYDFRERLPGDIYTGLIAEGFYSFEVK